MISRLMIVLLMVSFTKISFCQNGKMSFERLKALKMSYVTEKVGLYEKEETIFWEIYDEYEKKMYVNCRKNIRDLRKDYMKSRDSISDEEALQVVKKINELEIKALKIKEERDMALLEKFSAKLILKMHRAEYHFNREMIYKMKKSKEESQKN